MNRPIAAFVVLASAPALARVHPRFEPTDLELEPSGVMEIDLQLGAIEGRDASRIVAPDLELDLGLLAGVEVDLDGALASEGAGNTRFFDHRVVDNTWLSAKVGLFDSHDASHASSWALGAQVGPKLPTATGATGLGVEALLLVGHMIGPWHLVANAGGLIDPRASADARPVAAEGGFDLELELVPDRWSLLGELGGVWYHSSDPDQLAISAGAQWSPTSRLSLSLVALFGFLPGSDPFGILVGISPTITVW